MGHSHILEHSTARHGGTPHPPASGTVSSLPDDPSVTQMAHLPLLHAGVNEAFLFSAFTTSDSASFALACILLVVVACSLELIRLYMWCMEERYLKDLVSSEAANTCSSCSFHYHDRKNYNTISGPQGDTGSQLGLVSVSATPAPETTPPSRFRRYLRLLGVGFMQLQVYHLGTAVMLVTMTMNIYFILALGIGSAIGKVATLRIKEHFKTSKRHKPNASSSSSSSSPSSSSSSFCLSTNFFKSSWRPTLSRQ